MAGRREERHAVDFQVFLSWQTPTGVRRVSGRCLDLSSSGARLETKDLVEVRKQVLVESPQFGRMGTASIRYCSRIKMSYEVGLQFNTSFILSNPMRKAILAKVLRKIE